MKFSRRTFLHRSTFATVALAAGASVVKAASNSIEAPEISAIRELVSEYASRVTSRYDSSGQLIMVCEIEDLNHFSQTMAKLIPMGAQVQPDGNTLCFKQAGRQIQLENVWRS